MSKEVKLQSERKIFDAGPILTYKSPLAESDFKNFKFEEKSLGNLILSLNREYDIRFAIYCILEKTENSSVWHVFIDPSLSTSATIEKINEYDQIFGKNNWVKPEIKALTGIVHQELKSHALSRSSQQSIKDLIRKGQYEMGLSCSIEDGKITVVNRSTMQYSVQKIEELAKYANYYMKRIKFDSEVEQFYGRKYTLQFNLERSTEPFILKNFIEALNGALNQYLKKQLVDIPSTIRECYNIQYHTKWEKIRHNKRLLGEALLRTIYISASLKDETPGEFWPKETDTYVATNCIRLALAHEISLDVDRIPNEFAEKKFYKNALIQACRKETSDAAMLVMELVEQGANVYAWDGDCSQGDSGGSVFYYARKNSNKEIFKYINTIHHLIKAIKSSDEKGIRTYLDPNVIMIDRPIHQGMTALALAAGFGNLDAVLTVIKVLKANNKDISPAEQGLYLKYKSPLLAAAESGPFGNIIVLFCAGANPAELNLEEYVEEETGIIKAWSNPELLRTDFLNTLINNLIDMIDLINLINNRQEEKDGYLENFKKLKKAVIHAQKIVNLSDLASECYWKEIDSLARCALNIRSKLKPRGVYLDIMNSFLNDFMDFIPKKNLIFSSKIKFPEIKVTKEDEELFDKEIAKLKLQKKAFGKLIHNDMYWYKIFKNITDLSDPDSDPNLVLIRKMQAMPIVSLFFYKNIVQSIRVPRSMQLIPLSGFYAAVFKSQSIPELLDSKPVQEILQEQLIYSRSHALRQ